MRQELLVQAEAILEEWVKARGEAPTAEASEGFRLLALHRQGARGVPSFNACRETCRELMMKMLVEHLRLFVRGKLEVEGLGEFCCSSRALRKESETEKTHG